MSGIKLEGGEGERNSLFEVQSTLSTSKVKVCFKLQGPVVQSIVSLTSSLRDQLVKCFMTL